jgi:hypothetical protein
MLAFKIKALRNATLIYVCDKVEIISLEISGYGFSSRSSSYLR